MQANSLHVVETGERIEGGVLLAEAQKDAQHARALVLLTAEDHRIAVETFKVLKEKIKLASARKKAIAKKHDDAKKEALADYNRALADYEAAAEQLGAMIAEYQDGQAERERRAADAYGKALADGRTPDQGALVQVFSGAPAAKLQVQENWRFEVVDAGKVPREFLAPDEKKIGAIVRALRDGTDIPGVRVWCERSAKAADAAGGK